MLLTSDKNNKQDKKQTETATQNPTSDKPIESALSNNGQSDYFVLKLDKSEKLEWQKDFGGAED